MAQPAAAEQQPEEEKKEAAPVVNPMPQTMREQFLYAKALKEEGNNFYRNGDHASAIKKYSRVRAFLRQMIPAKDQDNAQFMDMITKGGGEDKLTKAETKEAVQIQASTFLNLSICYFHTQDYRKSIDRATESLDLQKSIKAHYRRAKALSMIKDYWGAVKDMKAAIAMDKTDPNNFAAEMAQF